jgi:membrane dipeptidase
MSTADLIARAEALHRVYPVVELHSDVPVDVYRRRRAGELAPYRNDYLRRFARGGVRVQLLAVGGDVPGHHEVGGGPEQAARAMIEDVRAEGVRAIETVRDLAAVVAGVEPGIVLHLEGCRPLETAGAGAFHALGVRSVQLTWNGPNAFADGVGVEAARGLTPAGRELVLELDELGVMIDVSHLAERGFWDLLELARGPVVATHANAMTLRPHRRNLTDEQIQALAQTGGFVGVCFIADYIGSEPTVKSVVDHVDHLVTLAGVESVAVGPDYVEFATDLMIEPGQESTHLGPEGLRRVETLAVFTAALLERGYSDDAVARILGGNALRVLRSVLPGA